MPNFIHPLIQKSLKEIYLDLDKHEGEVKIIHFVNNQEIDYFSNPILMGILNITQNSFSDGSLYLNTLDAKNHFLKLVSDGASIIDIGACSSRPGSKPVDENIEFERIKNILTSIKIDKKSNDKNTLVSIDTIHSSIFDWSFKSGSAHIWNIIKPNEEILKHAALLKCPIILMHNTKIESEVEIDFINILIKQMQELLKLAIDLGVYRFNVILDFGFGFKKSKIQNKIILKNLSKLIKIFKNIPILIALSKKAFLTNYDINDKHIVNMDLESYTTASAVAFSAISGGASLFRVHDVHNIKLVLDVIGNLK